MSRTIFGVLSLCSFATCGGANVYRGCIYVPVLHEIPHSDENNEDSIHVNCRTGAIVALEILTPHW